LIHEANIHNDDSPHPVAESRLHRVCQKFAHSW